MPSSRTQSCIHRWRRQLPALFREDVDVSRHRADMSRDIVLPSASSRPPRTDLDLCGCPRLFASYGMATAQDVLIADASFIPRPDAVMRCLVLRPSPRPSVVEPGTESIGSHLVHVPGRWEPMHLEPSTTVSRSRPSLACGPIDERVGGLPPPSNVRPHTSHSTTHRSM
jgi:hypothetical protein